MRSLQSAGGRTIPPVSWAPFAAERSLTSKTIVLVRIQFLNPSVASVILVDLTFNAEEIEFLTRNQEAYVWQELTSGHFLQLHDWCQACQCLPPVVQLSYDADWKWHLFG